MTLHAMESQTHWKGVTGQWLIPDQAHTASQQKSLKTMAWAGRKREWGGQWLRTYFSPPSIPDVRASLIVTNHHNQNSNGNPLQYSCLENPMDGGAWWAAVHRVARSRTWLSDFTLTFHFHALEKEMATHSSVLAWRIPGTGEPGGLPTMGLHRVGHDWSDLAAAAA